MKKGILFLVTAVLCLALCACGKAEDYEAATALMESGEYEKAAAILSELGSYNDSVQKLEECETILAYDQAVALMESGEYRSAAVILGELGNFKDSAQRLEDCTRILSYEEALELFRTGSYEAALAAFADLGEYADSAEKAQECETALAYSSAVALMEAGSYAEAEELFSGLEGYEESDAYRKLCAVKMLVADPLYLEMVDILGVGIQEENLDVGAVLPDAYGNGKTEVYFELKNHQSPAEEYVFEAGNDLRFAIPTTYGDLYRQGWRVEETNWQAEYEIKGAKLENLYPAGESVFCDMRNTNGVKMHFMLINLGKEPVELQEVPVISCDSEMKGISVNGITQGSTAAQIIDTFGWPALVHGMYGDGFDSITFYYHSPEPADMTMTISISAETGQMTHFSYTSWP